MLIRVVKFRVGSGWRIGALYSPAEKGSYGAVLLLHGFPGVQKNEDIAAELTRRGFVAFIPYFRGCWGSPGEYSLSGSLEDALTAHRLLSRYRHVDAAIIGVIGVSIGGWIALRLAAARAVAAVVAMAPAVEGDKSRRSLLYIYKNGKVLNIPSPRAVLNESVRTLGSVPPDKYMDRIAPAPVLFVQGMNDQLVAPTTTRKLFALAEKPKEFVGLQNESHDFQVDRPAVVRIICEWMERQLSARRKPADYVVT